MDNFKNDCFAFSLDLKGCFYCKALKVKDCSNCKFYKPLKKTK